MLLEVDQGRGEPWAWGSNGHQGLQVPGGKGTFAALLEARRTTSSQCLTRPLPCSEASHDSPLTACN